MSELRTAPRSFGSALGLSVAFSVVACVSGEFGSNGDDGGSAGTAARAGQGVGATGAVGGSIGSGGVGGATGGTGGATGGTGGSVGGAGAVSGAGGTLTTGGTGGGVTGGTAGTGVGGALATGGTGGVSGAGGGLTGGSAGTGASGGTGGTGNTCVDTPPPNGDTCANAVSFGWCGQPWMNGACAQSCDMCSGGSGGTGNMGGTGGTGESMGGSSGKGGTGATGGTGGTGGSGGGNVQPPPNISGGQQAWASRYWDCCKPACGWSGNVRAGSPMNACNQQNQDLSSYDTRNACESGGTAFMCWDGAPWQVGDRLSYGFVAASGPNYVCGRCFQLQFNGTGYNGNNPGVQGLSGKHMIVQVINNGGVAQDQFDLLIPGGGVGLLNACTNQWGTSDLGAQYGGFLTGCNGDHTCVRNKCMQVFSGKPELQAGCDWFLGWYGGADNPNVTYQRIACPSALTQRSGLTDPG